MIYQEPLMQTGSPRIKSNALLQGLRHADENGGGGGRGPGDSEARFFSEGNPYQKPKTQRTWPTIFLKMGDSPPHSQKWGDASPRPPVTEPLLCCEINKYNPIKRSRLPDKHLHI